jgi:hypothetical protein
MAEPRIPARPPRVRSLASTAFAALSLVLFSAHACVRSGALADIERGKEGRSWEDMSLAIAYSLHREFPVAFYEVRTDIFPREDPAFVSFRADLREATAGSGIRPWQFWRTIPADRFAARGPRYLAAISDDAGRAMLLGWAFRLLRGVSPYLLSWLAVLACLPVLAWVAWEFLDAGRAVGGMAFLALIALSSYAVEVLQLPYSAAGFYLLGALALVAFAVYAALGRSVSRAGLLARVGLAGAAIGIAAFCRQGTLFFLPAFVLGLAWPVGRVMAGRPRRMRVAALVGGTAAFLAPFTALTLLTDRLAERTARAYGAAAPPLRHRPWFSIWEGLGDFDRSKGYEWRDAAARRFLAEEGGGRLLGPRSERLFRARILRDVREDPLWFASILARRVAATATQWKLRPWGPTAGGSVAPASAPNEGLVDAYYRLTTTADWVGIADHRVEVPLPLLWVPALVLVVWRIARRSGGDAAGVRRADVRALGLVALGTATMPVAISTASALETQAFVLVYLLGFALLVDELAGPR